MSDIVERLREWGKRWVGDELNDDIDDAADTITTLRAEIERLRAALQECLGWHDYSNDMHKPIEVRAAYMRARAALEGKNDG